MTPTEAAKARNVATALLAAQPDLSTRKLLDQLRAAGIDCGLTFATVCRRQFVAEEASSNGVSPVKKTPTIPRRGSTPNLGPGAKAAPAPKLLEIPLKAIQEDHDTQSREAISDEVVAEYAEAEDLPPIDVFGGSGKYWIGDGWHRYLAAKRQDRKAIRARVHPGGKDEAIEHACGANRSHGLRRTREDVRRSIGLLLTLLAHKNYSDRQVSRLVGCTHPTVAGIRDELIACGKIYHIDPDKRTAVRGEKEYQATVSANQRSKPEPHPSQPASTLGHSHGAMANLTPNGAPSDAIPQGNAVGTQGQDAAPEAQGAEAESSEADFPVDLLREAEEERSAQVAPPKLADARWEETGGDEDRDDDSDPESDESQPEQASDEGGTEPDAWIRGLDVYRDLPERTRPRFEHDCRLWAAIEGEFKAFQKAVRPHLDEARADAGRRVRAGEYIPLDNTLSFFDLTVRYQKTRHPRAWSVCNHCKGEGQGGFDEPCGGCRGKGYRVN